jgi:valyl-tRNA synthetase
MDFGTGALKVTPGHDPTDFEIGRAHGLPEPMVIGPDGRMNENAGDLAGLTQEEADARILAWCRERGLLESRETYRHAIALCERCESRIEPLISLQWWCRMEELARPAIDVLRAGRVRYHPESQHRFAIASLETAPDWNISRQIWWGHRLPVWFCPDGHFTVAEAEPDACAECGSTDLRRSEEVLDTWFSSALWPFATLGWPQETPDLRRFYPGDLNTTAREIIRLWENRMIVSGLELMGEIPFKDVVIHAMVLAPDGRRMSKSLGNGVAPDEMIEKHGADATRYGLLKISSTQDTRFSEGAIEEGRKLANKLWNASRLLLHAAAEEVALRPTAVEERWILARLEEARSQLEDHLARFDFAGTVNLLYHLTFDDFCDWYLEAIKPRLYEADEAALGTALAALERLLKLLHPVMPHVTEEIWSNLPERETRLIVAPWPEPNPAYAKDARALENAQDAARIFRRSGIRVNLTGDSKRIFETVVRPDRFAGNGDVAGEIARLRAELARAEGKLQNAQFVAKADPAVVAAEREKLDRYRRELDALTG